MDTITTVENLSIAGGMSMLGIGLVTGASITGIIGLILFGYSSTYIIAKVLQIICKYLTKY